MDASTKAILEEIKGAGAEYDAFKREFKKLEDQAKKLQGQGEWRLTFPGLVKDYANAVKASGGLTSVKPSCSKAIDAAEKNPSVMTIKAAIKAVGDHSEEFKKSAKTDKKAGEFVKQMTALEKKLEKAL
ncbi:MAG TPA: hypothetical protein VD978_18360 [Azospirillum sp.]|nr:hypothetical protein [Azospirillum sp.]